MSGFLDDLLLVHEYYSIVAIDGLGGEYGRAQLLVEVQLVHSDYSALLCQVIRTD